ncbi:MAG: hypothetical protein ACT443_05430 [Gemmatimonadota bacterium]
MVTTACMMLAVAGCAVRLGGPSPVDRDAIALHVADHAAAAEVAQQIKQRDADFAILSAARDSAWFAAVAAGAELTATRPGNVGARTYAFLGPKALGDTTLTLKVPGGGEIRLHDALFQIDKNRRIDLLAVRLDSAAELQKSIETLLTYIATDVGANVAVLLAIEPPTPALGDSVSVLTRAAFADVWECTEQGRSGTSPAALPIRLFYGPVVRMRCESAERAGQGGLFGHFVLPR